MGSDYFELNHKEWEDDPDYGNNALNGTLCFDSQPSFGIEVLWNQPIKLWKPCVVINFWKIHIQFGFIWD